MPNTWGVKTTKAKDLDLSKNAEPESEDALDGLTKIKADISLDALQADVIKADSKEEIEEDLKFLQQDLETTNPVTTFHELIALWKPVEKLNDDEQLKLAEIDYTIGRYMVGNLMSSLMLKHRQVNWRIDEAAFREALAKLNISTRRGLQTELLNNGVVLSPAEQEFFTAFDQSGKFVNSYFNSHYQQEVVNSWVQIMPQCVQAYNQYYAQTPTGVSTEVKWLINDLKTKWFKETMLTNKPFKNAVIAGGILAGVAGTYSLIRSWTGKRRNRKGIIGGLVSWALTWAAAAAIGGGLTYRWMKEKEGKQLTFEESLLALQSDVQNKISENALRVSIGVVRYDELTKELMSYGTWTVIDKNAKRIPWLDVQFSDYKQMLHVANLMNYIRFTYKGRCRSTTPFYTGGTTGDVYIKTVKNENKNKENEIISGGRRSTLRSFCPDLDSFRWWDVGKEKLVQYLNSLPWRQQHDVIAQADKWEDVVEDLANDIQRDIEKAIPEVKLGGARWTLRVEKLSEKTNYYQVQSRDSKTFFSAKEKGKKKEVIYVIDNLDIEFESAKECIRVANLVNRTKKEFGGKCKQASPFFRDRIGMDGEAIYVYSKWSKGLARSSILFPFVWDRIRGKRIWTKTNYLDKSSAKREFPMLGRPSQRKIFIKYLNSLKWDNGTSLRYNQ